MNPSDDIHTVAASINADERHVGYIYINWGQPIAWLKQLADLFSNDIVLVTAREMVGIRRQELGLPSGYPVDSAVDSAWTEY